MYHINLFPLLTQTAAVVRMAPWTCEVSSGAFEDSRIGSRAVKMPLVACSSCVAVGKANKSPIDINVVALGVCMAGKCGLMLPKICR